MYLLLDPILKPFSLQLVSPEGELFSSVQYRLEKKMSEHCIESISSFVGDSGISPNNIKACVCLIGPGSYTSLRIVATFLNTFSRITSCSLYSLTIFDLEILHFLEYYDREDILPSESFISISLRSQYGLHNEFYMKSNGAWIWNSSTLEKKEKIREKRNAVFRLSTSFQDGFLEILPPEIIDDIGQSFSDSSLLPLQQTNRSLNDFVLVDITRKHIINKTVLLDSLRPTYHILPYYYAAPSITQTKKAVFRNIEK